MLSIEEKVLRGEQITLRPRTADRPQKERVGGPKKLSNERLPKSSLPPNFKTLNTKSFQ